MPDLTPLKICDTPENHRFYPPVPLGGESRTCACGAVSIRRMAQNTIVGVVMDERTGIDADLSGLSFVPERDPVWSSEFQAEAQRLSEAGDIDGLVDLRERVRVEGLSAIEPASHPYSANPYGQVCAICGLGPNSRLHRG